MANTHNRWLMSYYTHHCWLDARWGFAGQRDVSQMGKDHPLLLFRKGCALILQNCSLSKFSAFCCFFFLSLLDPSCQNFFYHSLELLIITASTVTFVLLFLFLFLYDFCSNAFSYLNNTFLSKIQPKSQNCAASNLVLDYNWVVREGYRSPSPWCNVFWS